MPYSGNKVFLLSAETDPGSPARAEAVSAVSCGYYIDYLNTFSYIPSLGEWSHEIIDNFNIEFYKRLYDYEIGQLETLTDNSIRQKHLWLLKKIEEQIQLMPKVKEYFDAENGKLQEQKDKRFSEALNGSKR